MPFVWLLIFSLSFFSSFTLTTALIVLAPKWKFYDVPNERKIHAAPIPYGGGISVFLTIYGFLISGTLVLYYLPLTDWLVALKPHYNGLLQATLSKHLGGILLGGVFIFIIGLVDDIKALRPRTKLFWCLIVALVVVLSGTKITIFSALLKGSFLENSILIDTCNTLITVLWVIGITNAFNLLDNMDGLCSGVAIIISGVLLILCIQTGQLFVSAFIILFMGAVGGFWVYNYNPAKIFLGDSGSLLIGYFLSIVTILPTFYQSNSGDSHLLSMFFPLLILAVPIYDTLSVFFIRYRLKKPFFQGDKNHFSHRLEALGLSRQQAVLLIYVVCLCSGLSVLLINRVDTLGYIIVISQIVLLFFIIIVLENAGRKKKME